MPPISCFFKNPSQNCTIFLTPILFNFIIFNHPKSKECSTYQLDSLQDYKSARHQINLTEFI